MDGVDRFADLEARKKAMGRLPRLETPSPPNRYERKGAGELIHVDVKKLGRIRAARPPERPADHRGSLSLSTAPAGSSSTSAVDDATRLAHAEVLADERPETSRRSFFKGRS